MAPCGRDNPALRPGAFTLVELPFDRLRTTHRAERKAFTLIELLVVIAILALLVSILLPSLQRAKDIAKQTGCLANLNSIGKACWIYATDNDGMFPGPSITGGHTFRVAPGKVCPPWDPRGLPEVYGMAAVLDRAGCIDGHADAWVCPAAGHPYDEYGNSYAFTVARMLDDTPMERLERITSHWLMWDNYIQQPGTSGFRGPFGPGYSIPYEDRVYFHVNLLPDKYKEAEVDKRYMSGNVLFFDCHAAPRYKED
jgi:prepilin-type N-terminal cleavage/methylation domain-containing protein/prepilin-type processing-associated H-X9-DG protein